MYRFFHFVLQVVEYRITFPESFSPFPKTLPQPPLPQSTTFFTSMYDAEPDRNSFSAGSGPRWPIARLPTHDASYACACAGRGDLGRQRKFLREVKTLAERKVQRENAELESCVLFLRQGEGRLDEVVLSQSLREAS